MNKNAVNTSASMNVRWSVRVGTDRAVMGLERANFGLQLLRKG